MSGVRARIAVITLVISGLVAWCGWVSGFHHSTPAAFATWSASLAAVAVVDLLFWRGRRHRRFAVRLPPARQDWPRPGRGGISRTLLGVAPWLVMVAVVLVWELLGIATGPGQPHLTISALALAFRPLDAALLLVWILVGVGYGAARARAPSVEVSAQSAGSASPGVILVGEGQGHHAYAPALLLPQSRAAGVTFWVGIVIVGALVDLAARRSQGRLADAEEFIRLISRTKVAQVLLIAAWCSAGWHSFAH